MSESPGLMVRLPVSEAELLRWASATAATTLKCLARPTCAVARRLGRDPVDGASIEDRLREIVNWSIIRQHVPSPLPGERGPSAGPPRGRARAGCRNGRNTTPTPRTMTEPRSGQPGLGWSLTAPEDEGFCADFKGASEQLRLRASRSWSEWLLRRLRAPRLHPASRSISSSRRTTARCAALRAASEDGLPRDSANSG